MPGINTGPVKIVSNVPIVAAERIIYKVNNVETSYSETMGLPDSQVNTTFWFPFYNNFGLDTQLRFANAEGDDQQDPIADSARGVLDGHFVLSRRLAEEGHYPAIDIEASISRVMPQVVSPEHLREAQRFKQLWSRYQQSRDLISVGAYVPGGDPETDLAIARQPQMVQFLRQGLRESESLPQSANQLAAIFNPGAAGR